MAAVTPATRATGVDVTDPRGVADLDWTFVSPAALIHPGERTGRYRLGGDQLVVDADGKSEVSAEDYAIADLLEHGGQERERITVAW